MAAESSTYLFIFRETAPRRSGMTPRMAYIEKALREETTSLDVVESPLNDVIQLLQERHKIPIVIDNKAFQEAAVAPDTPVTRSIHEHPLESTLELLLRDLDLTYVIRDDVLLITTKQAAENVEHYGYTAVYPVLDLIYPMSRHRGIAVEVARIQPMGYLQPDFDSLIETITGTVAPASWMEVGGTGSIKGMYLQGALVVSQTGQVHREVEALLTKLRQVRDQQLTVTKEADVPEPPADELMLKVYRLPELRGPCITGLSQSGAAPPSANLGGGMFAVEDGAPAADQPAADAAPAESPPAAAAPAPPQNQPPAPAPPPGPTLAEQLAGVIVEVIEPKSWKSAGGQGTIHPVAEAIVIEQTPAVHRKIEELLRAVFN